MKPTITKAAVITAGSHAWRRFVRTARSTVSTSQNAAITNQIEERRIFFSEHSTEIAEIV